MVLLLCILDSCVTAILVPCHKEEEFVCSSGILGSEGHVTPLVQFISLELRSGAIGTHRLSKSDDALASASV